MSPHPRPEPDPAPPIDASAEALPAAGESPRFTSDFADLAGRFSAPGGGGLPPDLAAELALEIVLNEIVMQACLATGATGAAIVLKRDEGMVCRATSGVTAPDLGSVLDTSSGLLAECIRSRRTERADDTLTDTRTDAAASLRLGVRSVMVMPLVRGEELVGAFELFSSAAFAFGDRDERTLEALASRTLDSLKRAAQPLPEVPPVSDQAEETESRPQNKVEDASSPAESDATSARRRLDFLTLLLAGAVVACALLLGMLLGRHFELQQRAKAHRSPGASRAVVSAPVAASAATSTNSTGSGGGAAKNTLPAVSPKTRVSSTVPPGSLQIFENGKEIYRQSPGESSARQSLGVEQAAAIESLQDQPGKGQAVLELPPAEVESSLLYRVEPHYPEAARQQQVEGAVVLEVHINADGSVAAAHLVSGPPPLVQAATDAVRQWRFRPRTQDGLPVRMHTIVTLSFRLPQ